MDMTPGWFAVDNAALDRASEVGPTGFFVYAALCRHANVDRRCWPSTRRLASLTGLHRATVIRQLDKLEAIGWIQVERSFGGTNRYTLPLIVTGCTSATGRTGATPTGRTGATPTGRTGATPTGRTGATLNKTNRTRPGEQDQENKTRARRKPAAPEVEIPEELDEPEFRAAWGEWLAYRKERKLTLTARTLKSQLTAMARWGHAAAIEAIQASIRNGWQGIFPAKKGNANGRPHNQPGPGQRYTPGAKIEPL